MKTKTLTFFTVVIFLFLNIYPSCRACYKPLEEFSDGYFRYVVVGEESRFSDRDGRPVIAIIGFTELGLQQDAIDIPREIAGKPVMFIGYWDHGLGKRYTVYSENIKKIYIYDNTYWDYDRVRMQYFSGMGTDLMFCYPVTHDDRFGYGWVEAKNMYYYGSLIENNTLPIANDISPGGFDVSPANVVFINNHSMNDNYGYSGLDNVEAGEKIHKPLDPERSGYEFIGWYTEPECKNAWDFDTVPVIEDGAEFKLYASWREIN